METNTNINELEQMRSQMNILKQKLSDQEIINKRLMRQSMCKRMDWIKKYIIAEFVLLPFVTYAFWFTLRAYGISGSGLALFMLIIIVDVILDYKVNKIKPGDWAELELIDIARRLTRMKRIRNMQFMISVPLLILLFVWMYFDSNIPQEYENLMISAGIGAIAGFIFAFFMIRKMNRVNDRIIGEINEITSDDNTEK